MQSRFSARRGFGTHLNPRICSPFRHVGELLTVLIDVRVTVMGWYSTARHIVDKVTVF